MANEHIEMAVGVGHGHGHSPRDLIAHARVTVFQVIAAWIARAPQFMQVSWQTTRRAHHHILRAAEGIDHTDHLTLAQHRMMPDIVDTLYFVVPFGDELVAALLIRLGRMPVTNG